MFKYRSTKKKKLPKRLLLSIFLILIIASLLAAYNGKTSKNSQANNTTGSVQQQFNKTRYSISDPKSLWVVVNKGRVLPANYTPSDLTAPKIPLRLAATSSEMQLRGEAAAALEKMSADAAAQNALFMLASGYRSYSYQVGVYNSYARSQGQASADISSAHPGHSEHQTGLAADLEPTSRKCEVEQCFAQTPEGRWLVANAASYGFIIRYPKGAETLTGYEYEPWHVRFVGKELAQQIQQTGQTLEQFFSLPTYNYYPSRLYHLSEGS